jgi:hypothetical protein
MRVYIDKSNCIIIEGISGEQITVTNVEALKSDLDNALIFQAINDEVGRVVITGWEQGRDYSQAKGVRL